MLQQLRAALSESDEEIRYECRQCGTMLEANLNHCPECLSREIASYHL
jgi:rubrerythrin